MEDLCLLPGVFSAGCIQSRLLLPHLWRHHQWCIGCHDCSSLHPRVWTIFNCFHFETCHMPLNLLCSIFRRDERAVCFIFFVCLVLPCQSSQYVPCGGGRVEPVWARRQWAVHRRGTHHHPSQLEWWTWLRVKSPCTALPLFQQCSA